MSGQHSRQMETTARALEAAIQCLREGKKAEYTLHLARTEGTYVVTVKRKAKEVGR